MKDLFKMLVELFRFPFQWDFWNILHLKHCLKTETEVSLWEDQFEIIEPYPIKKRWPSMLANDEKNKSTIIIKFL